MRKLVNRYLSDETRELGVWSMALLINTSTWKEMLSNWRLICLVFWNYDNDEDGTSKNYSNLLLKVQSISSDPNSNQAIGASKSIVTDVSDVFTFDEEGECHSISITGTANRMRKNPTISKNNREVMIFWRARKEFRWYALGSWRRKRVQSSWQSIQARIAEYFWWMLSDGWMENVIKMPVWTSEQTRKPGIGWHTSCEIIGRYPQQVIRTVKSFDEHLLRAHPQRTNAISERRMCIVKRTQLGGNIHIQSWHSSHHHIHS